MAKNIILMFSILILMSGTLFSQPQKADIYDDVGIYNKAYVRGDAELQDTFITISVVQARKVITLHQKLQNALTATETLTDISTRYQDLYNEQLELVAAKNKELKLKSDMLDNNSGQVINLQRQIDNQGITINRLETVNKALAQDLKKARSGRTWLGVGGVVVAATLTTLLLVN
jgi:hypothetical protein